MRIKNFGFVLLKLSGYFILFGGVIDLLVSLYATSLPESHLQFLKLKSDNISSELRNLDHALLGAIGACLVGVGIGTLTIVYGLLRVNLKFALVGLLLMVTISEGINAWQMSRINSPLFAFPLACVIISWIGALLCWIGNKRVSN